MKLCRTFLPLVFLASLVSSAQEIQPPPPRLPHTIRVDQRTALSGSLSPRIRGAQDLGSLAPGNLLQGMTLVFRRSPEQETDLQQLLAAQQDPSSPQFHHWLTPDQVAHRFGIAAADLDATERWLTAQGFGITSVSNAHDRITFSGSVRQVETAFSTSLHRYVVDGDLHFAPASALSLPSELAVITTAVLHLSDFRPLPKISTSPRPAYTTADAQAHYLTPRDLAVMYDFPATTNQFGPGAGQTIAIVGQSFVDLSISSIVRAVSHQHHHA